jgi:hypothetical protein
MDMVDALLLEDVKEVNWRLLQISNPRKASVGSPPASVTGVRQGFLLETTSCISRPKRSQLYDRLSHNAVKSDYKVRGIPDLITKSKRHL